MDAVVKIVLLIVCVIKNNSNQKDLAISRQAFLRDSGFSCLYLDFTGWLRYNWEKKKHLVEKGNPLYDRQRVSGCPA